jgi:hypothetical protein
LFLRYICCVQSVIISSLSKPLAAAVYGGGFSFAADALRSPKLAF